MTLCVCERKSEPHCGGACATLSSETTIIYDVFVPKQLNYFILSLHFLLKTFIERVYFNAKHTHSHGDRINENNVYVCVYVHVNGNFFMLNFSISL